MLGTQTNTRTCSVRAQMRCDYACSLYLMSFIHQLLLMSTHQCLICQEEFARMKAYITWDWKPADCRLFDPRPQGNRSMMDLLDHLGAARILYVGDSIEQELFDSLMVRVHLLTCQEWAPAAGPAKLLTSACAYNSCRP